VAVTEACACFVTCATDESLDDVSPVLKIDFHVEPATWIITVSNPDQKARIRSDSFCEPLSEGGLGLTIMRALVDLVEETDSDQEGTVFRLVKHVR
jgi:two-component sensor histidine kinase